MAGGWLWIRVSEEWGRCAPQSLCRVVSEFVGHYHAERNHQGLGNRLIRLTPSISANDGIVCRQQRLGGMLENEQQEQTTTASQRVSVRPDTTRRRVNRGAVLW